MIDVATERDGFNNGYIYNMVLVESECNIADGLTKSRSQAYFRQRLQTGTHIPQPVRWINRHKYHQTSAQ